MLPFQLNPGEKVGLVGPEGSGLGAWNIQSMPVTKRKNDQQDYAAIGRGYARTLRNSLADRRRRDGRRL